MKPTNTKPNAETSRVKVRAKNLVVLLHFTLLLIVLHTFKERRTFNQTSFRVHIVCILGRVPLILIFPWNEKKVR